MRGRDRAFSFSVKNLHSERGLESLLAVCGDVHIGSPDLDRVFFFSSSPFANAQTKVFVLVTNINLGRRGREKKN